MIHNFRKNIYELLNFLINATLSQTSFSARSLNFKSVILIAKIKQKDQSSTVHIHKLVYKMCVLKLTPHLYGFSGAPNSV